MSSASGACNFTPKGRRRRKARQPHDDVGLKNDGEKREERLNQEKKKKMSASKRVRLGEKPGAEPSCEAERREKEECSRAKRGIKAKERPRPASS